MFYEVKVKTPEGKIKKIISSKELSRRYWSEFNQEMSPEVQLKLAQNRKRRGVDARNTDYHISFN